MQKHAFSLHPTHLDFEWVCPLLATVLDRIQCPEYGIRVFRLFLARRGATDPFVSSVTIRVVTPSLREANE